MKLVNIISEIKQVKQKLKLKKANFNSWEDQFRNWWRQYTDGNYYFATGTSRFEVINFLKQNGIPYSKLDPSSLEIRPEFIEIEDD